MALGKVKYAHVRSSQLIGVIWFVVSLLAVSLSRSVVVEPTSIAYHSKTFFEVAYGSTSY